MSMRSTLMALALVACAAFPAELRVHGVLTRVERDQRYEAPCTVTIQMRDKNLCDVPPVCCSYHAAIVDSTGARTWFWAFWPKFAEGLRAGQELTVRLRRQRVYRLPCSLYGCTFDFAYAVTNDTDVSR